MIAVRNEGRSESTSEYLLAQIRRLRISSVASRGRPFSVGTTVLKLDRYPLAQGWLEESLGMHAEPHLSDRKREYGTARKERTR